VTMAPGIRSPLGSETVPLTEDRSTCPDASPDKSNVQMNVRMEVWRINDSRQH
jgi:hypothetical protein